MSSNGSKQPALILSPPQHHTFKDQGPLSFPSKYRITIYRSASAAISITKGVKQAHRLTVASWFITSLMKVFMMPGLLLQLPLQVHCWLWLSHWHRHWYWRWVCGAVVLFCFCLVLGRLGRWVSRCLWMLCIYVKETGREGRRSKVVFHVHWVDRSDTRVG